jgi:putative transposase
VYRLYREEGLTLRHKPRRKRRASLYRHERLRPTGANQVWSLDFVADQLADGRRFRALTILDVFTRESLAVEVGQRLKGEDVVGALNQIRGKRGVPKVLFCRRKSHYPWTKDGEQVNLRNRSHDLLEHERSLPRH